jgi:hypothetical protein
MTPFPRYVTAGCCLDPEHCSNRRFQDFRQHLLGSLELLRKNFKDFMYYDGRRNMKILDQCMDIRSMSDRDVWGQDPIHTTEAVYTKIAASVIKISSNLMVNITKRNCTDSLESGARTGPGAIQYVAGANPDPEQTGTATGQTTAVEAWSEAAAAAVVAAREGRDDDATTTSGPATNRSENIDSVLAKRGVFSFPLKAFILYAVDRKKKKNVYTYSRIFSLCSI